MTRIPILEDRLHQSILRTNQTTFESSRIKQENEILEKEQAIVSALKSKLTIELKTVTDSVNRLASEAAINNAAADSALKQMNNLDLQISKERDEFKKELTELNRLIENDRKMRDFIVQRQLMKQAEMNKPIVREIEKPVACISAAEKARIQELMLFFDSLQSATGIKSIERIIGYFAEKEMINYSLFTKVNLDRETVKKIKRECERINEEIKHIRSTFSTVGNAIKVDKTNLSNDDFTLKTIQLSKLLASLRLLIQAVFEKLFTTHIDPAEYIGASVLAASFGSNGTPIGTVTEDNLVEYLAAIELRIEELITVKISVSPTTGKDIRKKMSIVNGKMTQFKLPSALEDDNDEGEARDSNDHGPNRPFTREELRIKTLQSIRKNEDKLKAKRANLKFIS